MNEEGASLPRYPVDSDQSAFRSGHSTPMRFGLALLLVAIITVCLKCSGVLCVVSMMLAFVPCVGIGLLLTGFALFLAFACGSHRHPPHDR